MCMSISYSYKQKTEVECHINDINLANHDEFLGIKILKIVRFDINFSSLQSTHNT